MLRNFRNILIILSVLSLTGCVGETLEEESGKLSKGEKVTFDFTVGIGGEGGGCATKALTENAQIKNMYVAVFDGAGYKLSEYVKADLVSPAAGTNGKSYKYSVELTVANSKRILHFIANAPKKLTYGSESEVIGSLYTQLSNDDVNTFQESYWQRVELDNIPAKPLPGEDDTAYKAAASRLSGIELVRNYSKLTLAKKSTLTNFSILGMWLINYPDRGTVAPYNRNTGKFMSDYLSFTKADDIESLEGGNYQGFMLATTEYLSPKTEDDFIKDGVPQNMIAAESNTAVAYVYEREKALLSPMYLIVKAVFNSETCYYKVALQDSEGEFYSMLRNFNYLIEIQSVADKGKDTPYEALVSAPSGDISMNVEYQDITNISDGEARIIVNETTMVLIGEVGSTLTVSKSLNPVWYQYVPDISAPSSFANDIYPTNNPGVSIDIESEIGAGGYVIAPKEGQSFNNGRYSGVPYDLVLDDTDSRGYITFTTPPVEDYRRTQTIIVTGNKYDDVTRTLGTITRKINLILRTTLEMDLTCGPETDSNGNGHIVNGAGKPVTVTIGVEPDLPSSMFPMNFTIEAANRTLTPNGDVLPVESGTSTIVEKAGDSAWNTAAAPYVGRPSFWYVKTVTYADYEAAPLVDGKKSFTANFKANVNDSETDIYVRQPYFHDAKVSLLNYEASKFTGVSLSDGTMLEGDEAVFAYTLGDWDSNPARTVTVGLSGFEELTSTGYEKQLTYKGTRTEDGVTYDLYEMTAVTKSNSISLKAYAEGTGYVTIWADRYDSETRTAAIMGTNPWYSTHITITASDNFLNTQNGEPYAGQTFTTTLTADVLSGATVSNAKINGVNATASISTDGVLTITRSTSVSSSAIYDWPITATIRYNSHDYPLSEAINLYVWNFSRTEGTTRYTDISSFSNGDYIVIKHDGNYVYDDGSTNGNSMKMATNPSVDRRIWQIASKSGSTCRLQNYGTGRYVQTRTASQQNANTTDVTANIATLEMTTQYYNSNPHLQIRMNGYSLYLNDWQDYNTYLGWYTQGASNNPGSRFAIYKETIVRTRPTE